MKLKPDGFGNCWLGDKPGGAAIFKSYLPNKFFASLGSGENFGVLTYEGGIAYFTSAESALAALKKNGVK